MLNIVVHYGEIGTKGKNRSKFENILVKNILKSCGKEIKKVYKRYGKIVCEISSEKIFESTKEKLKFIPGVTNFSLAKSCELDEKILKEEVLKVAKKLEFETFKIVTTRSNKNFKLNSMETNVLLGDLIVDELEKKVDVRNPEIKIYVEIGEKEIFIYSGKEKGVGGLPVGASGKVLSSLSGGIDSPVSSYLMMKRGCKVTFVHIHNQTQTKENVKDKIQNLVKELSKVQGESKLYIVPFEKIQKQITIFVPPEYRMIVYRRFMMKILNSISRKEKTKAIVTGDNVGQVASQTLENINSIYDASEYPVLAPLIGLNKEEIINISKEIETYEHSIIPYPDCCSFMIAKHPETKSLLGKAKKFEGNVEQSEKLILDAVEKSKIINF